MRTTLITASTAGALVAAGCAHDSHSGRPTVAVRPASAQAALAEHTPAIMFLRTDGTLAVGSLDDSAAPPARSGMRCARVYYAAGRGVCLARRPGAASVYEARVFGPDFKVRHVLPLDGTPSRARVSADGRYGSVTLFVEGHGYAPKGVFSTETTIIDMASGRSVAELDDFTVTKDGRQVNAVDVNFWGATFAQDGSDRFYATLATAGKTYLIEGSVSSRTAHVIHRNVECPSVSPDGTRVAYKKRTRSSSVPWRLTVLDLETGRETPLAETRSVDDQVEWLDDQRVLYGLDGAVWTAQAGGGGRPRAFERGATSPTIVRR